MGLLRILTNTLCTLGARPQLPHVTPAADIRQMAISLSFAVTEPSSLSDLTRRIGLG
jgi:hypothetical protein